MACFLLAVDELKSVTFQELMQMVKRHLGSVGDGVEHGLAEKHFPNGDAV